MQVEIVERVGDGRGGNGAKSGDQVGDLHGMLLQIEFYLSSMIVRLARAGAAA